MNGGGGVTAGGPRRLRTGPGGAGEGQKSSSIRYSYQTFNLAYSIGRLGAFAQKHGSRCTRGRKPHPSAPFPHGDGGRPTRGGCAHTNLTPPIRVRPIHHAVACNQRARATLEPCRSISQSAPCPVFCGLFASVLLSNADAYFDSMAYSLIRDLHAAFGWRSRRFSRGGQTTGRKHIASLHFPLAYLATWRFNRSSQCPPATPRRSARPRP